MLAGWILANVRLAFVAFACSVYMLGIIGIEMLSGFDHPAESLPINR